MSDLTKKHDWLGSYNDMPPNFERITQVEFWQKFDGSYDFEGKTHKWVVNVDKDHMLYGRYLQIFVYYDKTAIGYVSETENARPTKPKIYFKTALCHHEMVESLSRGFLHTYKCRHCPHEYTVDSSG